MKAADAVLLAGRLGRWRKATIRVALAASRASCDARPSPYAFRSGFHQSVGNASAI
jgi:hypothetical protein